MKSRAIAWGQNDLRKYIDKMPNMMHKTKLAKWIILSSLLIVLNKQFYYTVFIAKSALMPTNPTL